MYQVAAAVRALGTRDWFDYLSVIAPLVLSVVAIWISISTARTQNRIALFDIRHTALYRLKTLLEFNQRIQGDISKGLIAFFFDAHFGTNIEQCDSSQGMNQVIMTINQLERDIIVRPFVRRKEDRKEIYDILVALRNLMLFYVLNDESTEDSRDELNTLCTKLYNGRYKKLRSKVRI